MKERKLASRGTNPGPKARTLGTRQTYTPFRHSRLPQRVAVRRFIW